MFVYFLVFSLYCCVLWPHLYSFNIVCVIDTLKDMDLSKPGVEDEIEAEPPTPVNQALPIDAYREEILHRIARDRVTVIHGETGCGKSSRVPAMLLEHAKETGSRCTMMVSQPRRIAASSLMKRLRETLGEEVYHVGCTVCYEVDMLAGYCLM